MSIALNENKAREFLKAKKLNNCEIKKVAGDASFRSYYRILSPEKNYILMFAPPSHEDVKPFIKIDQFLVDNGFFAPKIIAKDIENGFLLLEDFGDETFNRALLKNSQKEEILYQKACDVLLKIRKTKNPSDVAPYNNAVLFREVMLFVDWFLPMKGITFSNEQKSEFKHKWFRIFDQLSKENQVLVLRDYHADNLMEIEHGVGLLDFQDALIGSPAYDLVSLLEDARRDVSVEVKQKILEYYLEKSGCDRASFLIDYAILSLQRNIKILGIFARLSKRDGKDNYLNFIPRVAALVSSRLRDEIFSEIKSLISL